MNSMSGKIELNKSVLKKTESRRKIIEAALNIFASKGYHGSSMREISRTAGVSLGLTYVYFDSKTDLLAQVIGDHIEFLRNWTEKAISSNRFLVSDFLDFLMGEKAKVQLIFSLFMLPGSVPEISGLLRQASHSYEKIIYSLARSTVEDSLGDSDDRANDLRLLIIGKVAELSLPLNLFKTGHSSIKNEVVEEPLHAVV